MKILQINCVYNYGSTGRIVKDLHTYYLDKKIDSFVIFGRGKKCNEKNIHKATFEIDAKITSVLVRLFGMPYGYAFFSTCNVIAYIKKIKPDIIHLHCINGRMVNIYKLIEYLNEVGIKTVITMHAEFFYTGNCSYAYECNKWKTGCHHCLDFKRASNSLLFDRCEQSWKKMYDVFLNFNQIKIVSVSPWMKNRVSNSNILKNFDSYVIGNGINCNEYFHYQEDNESIRKKYNINKAINYMHITPNFSLDENDIKGGKYILELANYYKNTDRNVSIILVGNENKNIELPDNIIDVGRINDPLELSKLYSIADTSILVSKRETFSMVCIESLSCGTPVVGFEAGGPETIANKKYSQFVEYGNVSDLIKAINGMKDKKYDKKIVSKECTILYSKETMGDEYIKLYRSF